VRNTITAALWLVVEIPLAAIWGAVFGLLWLWLCLAAISAMGLSPYLRLMAIFCTLFLVPGAAVAGVLSGPLLDRLGRRQVALAGGLLLLAGALGIHHVARQRLRAGPFVVLVSIVPALAVVGSGVSIRLLGLHAHRFLARALAVPLVPMFYLVLMVLLVDRSWQPWMQSPYGDFFRLAVPALGVLGPVSFPLELAKRE
jgi:hypothetical protein